MFLVLYNVVYICNFDVVVEIVVYGWSKIKYTFGVLWITFKFVFCESFVFCCRSGVAAGGDRISDYSALLMSIGAGTINDSDSVEVRIPDMVQRCGDLDDLLKKVYPEIYADEELPRDYFKDRCCMAPTNVEADVVNDALFSRLGDGCRRKIYNSVNFCYDSRFAQNFTPEVLAKMPCTGVAPHVLDLRVGAPVILLRNIEPPRLCNGTRLVVVDLYEKMVAVRILTGPGCGDVVNIPAMMMKPTDFPINFFRVQLPLKRAGCITINKSQGQTFRIAGVYLKQAPWSHGQFYVAMSRVGDPSNLYVFAPGGVSANVVYREVLMPPGDDHYNVSE